MTGEGAKSGSVTGVLGLTPSCAIELAACYVTRP